MIEQRENQLVLSFPTPEVARAFAQFLTTLVNLQGLETSEPPSGQLPEQSILTPVSQEQGHSRHTVLTDERLEQLSRQRESGQTQYQRQLRAQTTMRDGVLPFSKPGQAAPQPSGQVSPRQRAQAEGGFADGAAPAGPIAPQLRSSDPQLRQPNADGGGLPERKWKSRLRPVSPSLTRSSARTSPTNPLLPQRPK